jgi:prevent-host-death family protein
MIANVQIISENNRPVFAVIPFAEFEKIQRKLAIAEKKDERISFPLEVAEMNTLKGYSLIKAWRIYKNKTQKELAAALGITQSAFSQIEKNETNQTETLRKVAGVLGVHVEQLSLED